MRTLHNQECSYGIRTHFAWARDNRSILYTTAGQIADRGLWSVGLYSGSIPCKLAIAHEGLRLDREYDGPLPLENDDALLVAKGELWRYRALYDNIVEVVRDLNRRIIGVHPPGIPAAVGLGPYHFIVQTMEPNEHLHGFWKVNLTNGKVEILLKNHGDIFLGSWAGSLGSKRKRSFI